MHLLQRLSDLQSAGDVVENENVVKDQDQDQKYKTKTEAGLRPADLS